MFRFLRCLLCAILYAFAGFLRGFFGGMTGIFHVLLRRVIVLVILGHRSGCEQDVRRRLPSEGSRVVFSFFTPYILLEHHMRFKVPC